MRRPCPQVKTEDKTDKITPPERRALTHLLINYLTHLRLSLLSWPKTTLMWIMVARFLLLFFISFCSCFCIIVVRHQPLMLLYAKAQIKAPLLLPTHKRTCRQTHKFLLLFSTQFFFCFSFSLDLSLIHIITFSRSCLSVQLCLSFSRHITLEAPLTHQVPGKKVQ